MTALREILIRRISASGPMTIAEYMTECLLHPEHGYYTTQDPFGAAGDFTTAPEISQMFGELVGLALAQAWLDQGCPSPFTLAEIGPGRGTLMADTLRACRSVPGMIDAAQIHLVEASPKLRQRQNKTLGGYNVIWCDTVQDLPMAPLFLIANEFFDALPIRQFTRDAQGWRERQVGLKDGKLSFGLGAATPFASLDHRLGDTQPGDIVETCAPAASIVAAVADRVALGGGALLIDYGGWRSLGDTFQALENHQMVDALEKPGQADLTAHVDFEVLANSAGNVTVSELTTQGVFLERLGITHRAQTLAQKMTGAELDSHIAAHRRLTHPDEMGTLFKVLGLTPRGAPALPGLTP